MRRYDHQERLTAMEAMEHAYFHPVVTPALILTFYTHEGYRSLLVQILFDNLQVREHGRLSNISGSSPTAGANLGATLPAQVDQMSKKSWRTLSLSLLN